MILWAIREGSQNSVDVIHESPLTATLIIVIIVVEGAFTKLNWLKTTSTEARELYMHFIRVLPSFVRMSLSLSGKIRRIPISFTTSETMDLTKSVRT